MNEAREVVRQKRYANGHEHRPVLNPAFVPHLQLWANATERAKLWLQILTETRNRGVADILVACVDGLKGLPETISTVYPRTEVQLCIMHMVRNSLAYVNWKERKAVAEDLRGIYRAEG